MSRVKHSKVMSALEKRALWFWNKGQKQVDQDEVIFNKDVHKIGTVLTVGFTYSDGDTTAMGISTTEATCLENEEIQGVSHGVLNVYGIVPGAKPGEVIRLIYKNPDCFNTRMSDNEKLEKTKRNNQQVGGRRGGLLVT